MTRPTATHCSSGEEWSLWPRAPGGPASQVLLQARATGFGQDSKAQVESVRSVAGQGLGPRLGKAPPAITGELDEALRLHLAP